MPQIAAHQMAYQRAAWLLPFWRGTESPIVMAAGAPAASLAA